MGIQIARLVIVLALLGVAAAIAMPRGRLSLALRGVLTILKRDGRNVSVGEAKPVSSLRRLFAFVLVLLAVLLALI